MEGLDFDPDDGFGEEGEEEEDIEDLYPEEEEEEEELIEEEMEDLFEKNTESFRCLAQILISRSSLLKHILYNFPPLVDPGIDDAFNYVEPEPVYDDIGCEKYKNLCKDLRIVPITRVLKSLNTEMLNLKYYGLSVNQTRAVCATLMLNNHVKVLILQDNWMQPEAVFWIGEMLRENNSIQILNMSECRIGPEGTNEILEGLSLNQALRELDLSYNNLGDEGLATLIRAMQENQLIQKLNLSHNNLGVESGKILGNFLSTNSVMDFLDLSWNDLYSVAALKPICVGLSENECLKYLNLAWNGIGNPDAVLEILKYLKKTPVLEHFDISHNRLMGDSIRMIKAGISQNTTLNSVNLGFNLITPDDALFLLQVFTQQNPPPLQYMDLENVFVNKNFLPVWRRIKRSGRNVKFQGVLSNYRIIGPDISKVLFDRCRYLAQKPKKKKKKKNFGHFLYSLDKETMNKKLFKKAIKKFRIKGMDADLITGLCVQFAVRGDTVNTVKMRETYLSLYPDTEPPQKKKKKRKKKKRKKAQSDTTTEDKTTETTKTGESETEPIPETRVSGARSATWLAKKPTKSVVFSKEN